MLRPVRMFRTSLIFLKSDAEKVLEIANKKGNLHLSLGDLASTGGVEFESEIESLRSRIRDLVAKARGILPDAAISPVCESGLLAKGWDDYIRQVDSELSNYEGIVQRLEESVKREAQLESLLSLWKKSLSGSVTAGHLDALSSMRKIGFAVVHSEKSTIADLKAVLQESCIIVEAASEPAIALLVFLASKEKLIMRQAESAGFRPIDAAEGLDLGPLSFEKRLEVLERKAEEIRKERQEKLRSLQESFGRMLYLEQSVNDAFSVLSIKSRTSYSKSWAVLEGYVPKEQAQELINDVRLELGGRVISFMREEPTSATVPVSFKYPRFFKIFDSITNLYGSPSYNEVNPTPILALSFPILFGLMFGDLGHGLALAALGAVFYRFFASMKKIGLILMITGVAGALIGAFVYGEFFGQSLHHLVGYEAPIHPSEELMTMMKISLFVGVTQISLGLCLSFANSVIQRKYSTALLVNLPKLALYIGFMYVVFAYGLNLMDWFSGPIYFILAPLLLLLLAEPMYEILRHGKAGLGKLGTMFFEVFETMIAFVSNTVSYLRIFAMVVAHVMLTSVFYSLADLASGGSLGVVLSPLLIVVGNVFVVLLEGILVLAQDLRLHFYEWFSKFYNNGGIRFSPFRLSVGMPVRVSK